MKPRFVAGVMALGVVFLSPGPVGGQSYPIKTIALDRPHGNHSHYRSARHIGISEKEIVELIIQVAAYAGWPVVGHAIEQYTQVLEEDAAMEKKNKIEKKIRPRRSVRQ